MNALAQLLEQAEELKVHCAHAKAHDKKGNACRCQRLVPMSQVYCYQHGGEKRYHAEQNTAMWRAQREQERQQQERIAQREQEKKQREERKQNRRRAVTKRRDNDKPQRRFGIGSGLSQFSDPETLAEKRRKKRETRAAREKAKEDRAKNDRKIRAEMHQPKGQTKGRK